MHLPHDFFQHHPLMIGCPAYKRAVARKLLCSSRCPGDQLSRGIASKPRVGGSRSRGRSPPVDLLVAETDVAQQLLSTGFWRGGRTRMSKNVPVDTRRVNIVSKDLCSDIINYIGPSLERHAGCDLLDLNPGAGLWSRALHDKLQPRKHILLDLDAEFYKPYLGDFLSRPNVELMEKSGIIWDNLEETVSSKFTSQVKTNNNSHELGAAPPPQRNDTLLVTANLSMCPKRAYRGFDNVGTMVVYQFLSSIRQSSLLQQYGLVRFLIWTNDEDKHRLLPRSLLRRRRSAFEAELSCEWLHEVCGSNVDLQARMALRDEWLNLESGAGAVARMQAARMSAPPAHRQTDTYKTITADPAAYLSRKLADTHPPQLTRPYIEELEYLQSLPREDLDATTKTRLTQLTYRDRHEHKFARRFAALLHQRQKLIALASSSSSSSSSSKTFAADEAAYVAATARLPKNKAAEFQRVHDNYHLFRQQPHTTPAMLWDRRAYEPLVAHATEFFPNAPTTLLDMQPKAMHPLLRQYGANTSRSGEMSDVLLHMWFANTLGPIEDGLDRLWGGFGSEVDKCPSFFDAEQGGLPMRDALARVRARCVNETQWLEVLQAWMDWPFRPPYTQLLGRWAEEQTMHGDEDAKSGAQGLGF